MSRQHTELHTLHAAIPSLQLVWFPRYESLSRTFSETRFQVRNNVLY